MDSREPTTIAGGFPATLRRGNEQPGSAMPRSRRCAPRQLVSPPKRRAHLVRLADRPERASDARLHLFRRGVAANRGAPPGGARSAQTLLRGTRFTWDSPGVRRRLEGLPSLDHLGNHCLAAQHQPERGDDAPAGKVLSGGGRPRSPKAIPRLSAKVITPHNSAPAPGQLASRYGRWAVIAGASDGIGAEFARQVAAAGIHCVLVARRQGALEEIGRELQRQYRVDSRIAAIDLSLTNAAELLEAATADLDVGLFVYNAG